MKIRALTAMAAAALLAAGTIPVSPALATGEGYKIDPVHSFVLFRIKHLDMGYVHGRFDDVSGTVQMDAAGTSSVQFEIKAESVDTGTKKRDDHLRSPDFFNVAQFPTISFKSTSVKKVDATHYDVVGDLTLHGATKPVTVHMEKGGEGKDPFNLYRVGFEGTFVLQRSQWGMTSVVGPGSTSDDVRVTIAVEATRPL